MKWEWLCVVGNMHNLPGLNPRDPKPRLYQMVKEAMMTFPCPDICKMEHCDPDFHPFNVTEEPFTLIGPGTDSPGYISEEEDGVEEDHLGATLGIKRIPAYRDTPANNENVPVSELLGAVRNAGMPPLVVGDAVSTLFTINPPNILTTVTSGGSTSVSTTSSSRTVMTTTTAGPRVSVPHPYPGLPRPILQPTNGYTPPAGPYTGPFTPRYTPGGPYPATHQHTVHTPGTNILPHMGHMYHNTPDSYYNRYLLSLGLTSATHLTPQFHIRDISNSRLTRQCIPSSHLTQWGPPLLTTGTHRLTRRRTHRPTIPLLLIADQLGPPLRTFSWLNSGVSSKTWRQVSGMARSPGKLGCRYQPTHHWTLALVSLPASLLGWISGLIAGHRFRSYRTLRTLSLPGCKWDP